MNLWVRSQDKRILQKVDNIFLDANYENKRISTYDGDNVELGTYKTKERALEVLDEIHKCIIDKEVLHACNNLLTLINKSSLNNAEKIIDRTEKIAVYQMPED